MIDKWIEGELNVFSVEWFDFGIDKAIRILFIADSFDAALSGARDYFDDADGEIREVTQLGYTVVAQSTLEMIINRGLMLAKQRETNSKPTS